jgi:prenyltransferase beta subunit
MRPVSVLLALAFLQPSPSPAGDRDGKPAGDASSAADRVTKEHQAAIDAGIDWLAKQQLPSGAFPTTVKGGNEKGPDYQTAVTALSTLAFLGAGHGLRHGPYQKNVQDAVRWLLDAQDRNGYVSFSGDTQSKMHGHGFATLALAEAYGTAASLPPEGGEGPARADRDNALAFTKRLREGIEAAVRCIESSQSVIGGWYYDPRSTTDHEGSVTVCEVQALLAASNRGFRVDMEVIRKGRNYMRRSQAPSGGFKYKIGENSTEGFRNESWALTAAGITSLIGLAEYDRKEALDKAFEYLQRKGRPRFQSDRIEGDRYPLYGSFYAVQAYHWLGGRRWEEYWKVLRHDLLSRQKEDGRWEGQDTLANLGPVYPTAFCLLMLEVPVGYLSVYAK